MNHIKSPYHHVFESTRLLAFGSWFIVPGSVEMDPHTKAGLKSAIQSYAWREECNTFLLVGIVETVNKLAPVGSLVVARHRCHLMCDEYGSLIRNPKNKKPVRLLDSVLLNRHPVECLKPLKSKRRQCMPWAGSGV